jgi:hypothetical protein
MQCTSPAHLSSYLIPTTSQWLLYHQELCYHGCGAGSIRTLCPQLYPSPLCAPQVWAEHIGCCTVVHYLHCCLYCTCTALVHSAHTLSVWAAPVLFSSDQSCCNWAAVLITGALALQWFSVNQSSAGKDTLQPLFVRWSGAKQYPSP